MTATLDKDVLINDILTRADRLFRELLPTVPKDLLALDVTMPQTKILLLLHVTGPRRMSDLASELGVSLPAATSLVDRLVDKGYVIRETRQDDRRVVVCHLSEAGQKAIGLIWQSARKRSHELLESMAIAKLQMLNEALGAMHDIAQAQDASPDRQESLNR